MYITIRIKYVHYNLHAFCNSIIEIPTDYPNFVEAGVNVYWIDGW